MQMIASMNQPIYVSSIVVLAICASLTLFFACEQWYQDWIYIQQPLPTISSSLQNNDGANLLAAIPHAHLFGQSEQKMGEIPITNLRLRVTGIVKTNNIFSPSKAYIAIDGEPSKIYRIGDQLPDGVTIHAITNDIVVLENAGRLEKLPLPRLTLQFKPLDFVQSPR